jgi:hypothetical protein
VLVNQIVNFLEIVPKELGEEMVKSFGKDELISIMINFGKDTMNSQEIKSRSKKRY